MIIGTMLTSNVVALFTTLGPLGLKAKASVIRGTEGLGLVLSIPLGIPRLWPSPSRDVGIALIIFDSVIGIL